MKVRSIYLYSIVGLLLIVLVQMGGMWYAYRNNQKEVERSLNECFRMAFIETVDNQINQLPFPDGTIPFYTYTLKEKKIRFEDRVFMGYQQSATFLKDEYQKDIPLSEMTSVLKKKLKWEHIDTEVIIRPVTDSQKTFWECISKITSEKVWLHEPSGKAIEAVIVPPSILLIKDILYLFLLTLILVILLIYSLVVQMRSIIRQQRNIGEQQEAFYGLAEQMRLPIKEIQNQLSERQWEKIEQEGRYLLDGTERTLSIAKEEEQQKQARRRYSFKTFFMISLTASFLLLIGWFVYLYHTAYGDATYHVNDCFEAAFYDEVMGYRYPLLLARDEVDSTDFPDAEETPFAKRQIELLNKEPSKYEIGRIYVVHIYNKIDLNYRLRTALIVQRGVNESGVDIPASNQYLDSAFSAHLQQAGFHLQSGVRQLRYPSDSTVCEVGYALHRKGDVVSQIIPLKEDSTLFVQGVVQNPYRYVLGSVWYLLIPLGLIFLVILSCILAQVKVLRTQRYLEQFQKDFTYAMIHDMKSPLNSILMGAHILSSGKLSGKPEKEEKYCQAMMEECGHLLTLSGRVVLLTQLDEGHLLLNKEEVLLRSLLDDLIGKFTLKAGKKVEFTTIFHRCDSVPADSFCLREVLSNLLDNAIKYSREEVKIDIVCESEKGFCKIKICDNGWGIPLKDQHRIFNRFERSAAVARSGKGGASGFGLGLNYVRQVMLAHGGRVEVESQEGQFSEFTLYFPAGA